MDQLNDINKTILFFDKFDALTARFTLDWIRNFWQVPIEAMPKRDFSKLSPEFECDETLNFSYNEPKTKKFKDK